MGVCAACSANLADGVNFCPNCGASAAAPVAAAREVRKTVTVLFSDLAGSTALGERLDPEQMRGLMARYFAAMAAVIERHGGTVEKYIGDAIMAVFGIPVVHEDDALRAVRAASEMRDALRILNADLASRGFQIRTRTGINTGEVVSGDPSAGGTLVTGDAVNTAARLEQAAEPGEILIGEGTLRLARDAVTAEEVPSMALKGKSLPVVAYRLLEVAPGAEGHTRRVGGPLIGRERELGLLLQSWDRVVEERSPQLFTLLGTAGVGKSRLTGEFAGRAEGATILRGRCLPYGDGITYWPLAEALRSAAHIDETDDGAAARGKIEALTSAEPNGEALATRLQEAIGLVAGGAPQEELFWAVRRTFESLARRRPVIVVWDDIHWAEPTFLDLVEHLADWARDAPLLILAMARPELLEVRPGWGGGKLNATTILLESLAADASADLIAALPGGDALPDDLRRRILETAEGNPLFLEEMLRTLVDEDRLVSTPDGWKADADIGRVRVPPSISALLAARLDRLGPGERGVAERASVIGRTFERGAVIELSPPAERSEVGGRLLGLVRKELVRLDSEPGLAGDDAFRFRHLLIRDAAYEALPKLERARLHEAFAGWLERATGDRLDEYEEVVAHHLEEAYRYRIELGETDVKPLGRRAAERLTSAARRAQARGDMPAATSLRELVLGLPISPDERVDALIQLARNHLDTGAWETAVALLDRAEAEVDVLDPKAFGLKVLVGRGFVAMHRDESSLAQISADAQRAAAGLEEAGDAAAVARAMDLLAWASLHANDTDTARVAWRAAAVWAARSGDRAEEARILPLLPATATYGWTTTSEAIAYCRELAEGHPDSPMLQVRVLSVIALQHALRDERKEAFALRERSRAAMTELGMPWLMGENHCEYAYIDLLVGDATAAEQEAIRAFELMEASGHRHAWVACECALYALRAQQRYADASAWLDRLTSTKGGTDEAALASSNAWRALLSAVDGDASTARAALEEPVPPGLNPWEVADLLNLHSEAFALIGDRDAALDRATQAATIYARKEISVPMARFRERGASLLESDESPADESADRD